MALDAIRRWVPISLGRPDFLARFRTRKQPVQQVELHRIGKSRAGKNEVLQHIARLSR